MRRILPFLDDYGVEGPLDPLVDALEAVDVELLVADQVDRAAASVSTQGLGYHWVLSLG